MKRAIRIGALAALVTSCGGGRYGELPAHERDRFQRCNTTIMNAQCGDDRNGMYRVMCSNNLASRYAEEPTEAARQQWLVGQGCPPAMVGYTAAAPSSGGAAPAADESDVQITRANDPTAGTTLTFRARMQHFTAVLFAAPETAPGLVRLSAWWGPNQAAQDTCAELALSAGIEGLAVEGSQRTNDGTLRRLSGTLPLAELRRYAEADGLGVRLCDHTDRFSGAQAAAVHTFLQRLDVLLQANRPH